MRDLTLSDGTFIPKDTLIAAASYPMHYDDVIYENAATFDPFRFSRMREEDGEGTKHQFVNTSVEYIPFGHGKHAWCAQLPAIYNPSQSLTLRNTARVGSLRRTSSRLCSLSS